MVNADDEDVTAKQTVMTGMSWFCIPSADRKEGKQTARETDMEMDRQTDSPTEIQQLRKIGW